MLALYGSGRQAGGARRLPRDKTPARRRARDRARPRPSNSSSRRSCDRTPRWTTGPGSGDRRHRPERARSRSLWWSAASDALDGLLAIAGPPLAREPPARANHRPPPLRATIGSRRPLPPSWPRRAATLEASRRISTGCRIHDAGTRRRKPCCLATAVRRRAHAPCCPLTSCSTAGVPVRARQRCLDQAPCDVALLHGRRRRELDRSDRDAVRRHRSRLVSHRARGLGSQSRSVPSLRLVGTEANRRARSPRRQPATRPRLASRPADGRNRHRTGTRPRRKQTVFSKQRPTHGCS